jgi:uncharacterized membrane protein
VTSTSPHPPTSHLERGRLAGAGAVGLVATVTTALLSAWQTVPLIGWIAGAGTWVAWTWAVIARLDAEATGRLASREVPHKAQTDLLLLSAAVLSLIAVALGVIKAGSTKGGQEYLLLGTGIGAIVVSWAVVHTVFTLRYAALFYQHNGGVDFNEKDEPCYADFAYLAFTLGMTYQVSDTDLTTKAVRHTALRHALLSYLFGTVIIAATINLAAGLAK